MMKSILAKLTKMAEKDRRLDVYRPGYSDHGNPKTLGFELPQIVAVQGEVTTEHVKTLVAYGAMGISGGNCQPWRFVYRSPELLCFFDRERSQTFLDYRDTAGYLALGSVVENIDLVGRAMGLSLRLDPFPDSAVPDLVCNVRIAAEGGEVTPSDELAPAIAKRVTNRRLGKRTHLPLFELESLSGIADDMGARLQWIVDDDALDRIGDILAEADLLRMTSKVMYGEMMNEVRWTPEEAESTRDGLDVATLELSATDLVGLKLLRSWRIMKATGIIGGGFGLKRLMRNQIAAASAVGLLTTPGFAPEDFFNAGRILQRIWLFATTKNISAQPVTPITYLFYRLEQGDGEGLAAKQLKTLRSLRKQYRRLLDVPAGHAEPMIFRVFRGGPPTARSLRRRVEDILTLE